MTVVAEDVLVRIRADMADLDTKMTRAAAVTTSATRTIEQQTRLTANATRNLGRQVADVGAQLAGGQSPFLILAQQAPQVADALADTGGKAARVAAFFAGPWGAAILAAASVVGVLVGKMYEAGSAADKTKPQIDRLTNAYTTLAANLGKLDTAGLDALARSGIKLATDRRDLAKATDDLAAAQARLAGSQRVDSTGRGSAPYIRDVAEAKARVAALKQEIETGQNFVALGQQRFKRAQGIAAAEARSTGGSGAGRLNAEARLGAADTGLEKARAQLALTKAQAAEDLKAGRISESSYRARVQAAEEAVQQQQRLAASSKKTASDEKKEQQELIATLERVAGKYDPVRSAAIEAGKAMADIDKLAEAGIITAADAAAYKIRLAAQQARDVFDAAWKVQEQRWLDVGISREDMDGSGIRKKIDADLEQQQAKKDELAERGFNKQEAQIRSLATLYEDAFRGGSDAVWADFKQLGFRVLAEMLARWSIMKLSGGGGDSSIGGLFTAATQSVLGFAEGGYTGSGPRNQVAGVVHRGEFVMPASAVERIGVPSLAALASGQSVQANRPNLGNLPRESVASQPRQVIVQQSFTLDARHGITTPQLLQHVESVRQQALSATAAMGKAVDRNVPNRLARFQADGI